MRRTILCLMAILLVSPLWATWDKGFNFRDTSGYVTDGTDETYVVTGSQDYPQTRNSVTFGFDVSASASDHIGSYRDRNSGNDRRVAGVGFGCVNATPCKFKVDLPATGDYDIYGAFGDPGGGANTMNSKIYDNTTLLTTLSGTNASGEFFDISGTNRTSASDWVTNGSVVKITKTFATTTFIITIEGSSTYPINHIRIVQVASGGGTTPSNPRRLIFSQ